MSKPLPMTQSARCGARTKQGTSCRCPAVRGRRRCRRHGGAPGSGAPVGKQNALKHGRWAAAAIAERRQVRELIRVCRGQLSAMV